jgi:hypothetical protein
MGTYGLAMSRCFGDLLGKASGVLTAQPTIRTLNFLDYHAEDQDTATDTSTNSSSIATHQDNNQLFVVVVSDGVLDYMPIQHVAEQVVASLYPTNSASPSLAQTCHSLV